MKLPPGFSRAVKAGSGSFASVYRAFDGSLQRYCALKIIPAASRTQLSKVLHEARQLSGAHPSSAPHIYDIIRQRGMLILVMEWVSGIPLSQFATGELALQEKAVLAADLLDGLAHLHRNGIIHGDLKPDNVVLVPGRGVVFVDFGFAHPVNGSRSRKPIAGTPAYMAPELWKSDEDVDGRKTDCYAAGVMLSELFGTGLSGASSTLTSDDPALRSVDVETMVSEWKDTFTDADRNAFYKNVADASAAYLSGLLCKGAGELLRKNNRDDAYTVLSESIDLWPDNSEALALLQTKFSSPARKHMSGGYKFYAAGLATAGLLVAAYFLGRTSKDSQPFMQQNVIESDRGPSRLSLEGGASVNSSENLVLRNNAKMHDLMGTVAVYGIRPPGTLFVDGVKMREVTSMVEVLDLPAGNHRIEWLDVTTKHRTGETIDLLPFSHKSMSLSRKVP